ncbi:MAG: 5-(carboxyamino)imidazole ribonucleotide synthase [Gemmatimonadaceae bacterium]
MKVGVVGAGQLGQMLALAGRKLSLDFRFLSPDSAAPAGKHAELVVADYSNESALTHFADGLDVATYEFESIPSASLKFVASLVPVYPPVLALETTQDRAAEKACFEALSIPTSKFAIVDSMREVREALSIIGLPVVLKSRTLGYDGKGQSVIRRPDDVASAWVSSGGVPAIVESFVKFKRELSVISVRSRTGEIRFYPLVENHHSEGILRFSLAPAPGVTKAIEDLARGYATSILNHLDYVGVLAIEFFETDEGLVANEMAPRVHNTGHWTIEGADTSQFENHLRAIAGLPLGSTEMGGSAGMVNVIGHEPAVRKLDELNNVHVHMYGKKPRSRRKLGHITVTGDSLGEVMQTVARVRNTLASR